MAALKDILVVGKVVSYNSTARTARVFFPDSGTTSGNLYVIRQGTNWMPQINDMVLCAYLPVEDGDGFILGVI